MLSEDQRRHDQVVNECEHDQGSSGSLRWHHGPMSTETFVFLTCITSPTWEHDDEHSPHRGSKRTKHVRPDDHSFGIHSYDEGEARSGVELTDFMTAI